MTSPGSSRGWAARGRATSRSAHVDDVALTTAVARDLGCELAAAGVNLDYAPDADVNNNPDNPVIGVRSFGADPALVARHTAAWVTGLQEAGVAACAKHFPGHGDTAVDSHHDLPRIAARGRRWTTSSWRPFRAAIAAGVQAIMTGHLLVPAVDPELPATLSRPVLTDLLRDELGFQGAVITDGIEMRGDRRPVRVRGRGRCGRWPRAPTRSAWAATTRRRRRRYACARRSRPP